MKTSIIILNWNTLSYLKKCINSIKKYTKDYELIIVDNGSTEKGTKEYIRKVADKAYFLSVNIGFSRGNNYGASIASGDFLCFMNSDIVVKDNWLEEMYKTFENNKNCGAVGPLGNPKKRRINGKTYYFTQYIGQYNKDTKVEFLVGFCILIKRELFDEIKGWDEDFFNGFEDSWLSLMVRREGLELIVSAKSNIIHYAGVAHSANKIDYSKSLISNQTIYQNKLKGLK